METGIGIRRIVIESIGQKLSKEITNLLTEAEIEKQARKSGFVIRTSKLSGWKFLEMLLFTEFNHKKLSLNELSIQLKLRFNIDISKQGIDERFTQAAVNFVKSILEKAIKIIIAEDAIDDFGHFAQFTQVKIKDSTSFQLPSDMAEKYPGSGGSASKAAIRIQFEYDFKTGKISDLSLHPSNEQDLTDAHQTRSSVMFSELIIRDLGYSNLDVFEYIIQSEAYFLSRLKYNINVYEKKGNEFVLLDFGKIEEHLRITNQTFIEKNVYIGETKKLPVRLLIELFPEDKKQKRLENAHKEAKRKGRKVGKCYKERYGLNLFITNIDEKMMEGQKLRKLYLLRWQIELMFKTWKSIGEIHRIKKMKIERFESYLYAKLLWIVINWKVFWQMQICAIKNKDVVLSAFKVFTTFRNQLHEFRQAIAKGQKAMYEYINDIMSINVQKFKVENRKERLSLQELIETY